MRPSSFPNAALAATLPIVASAQGSYTLKDDLTYNNFFQNFDFFSGSDPTNGFVQYQTKDAATQNQLVGYFEDTQSVFLGVDYKNKDPKGRASVRVESTKTWNQGLLIADIRHMPDSTCGTWPAYWLLGQQTVGTDDWPKGGEIDLLEGVNLDSAAAVTLHTSAGCAVDNATSSIQSRAESAFMGSMSTSNCDVAAEDQDKNVGCSIQAPKLTAQNNLATYGTDFNNAGGGVYAMEWTDSSISVWFLPRNSTTFASASSNATQTLDPSTFGTPLAKFQGQGCDFQERFKNMRIIFDTTFCGDWAGKTWEESTCAAKTGAATCEEYVQNNPEAFADAYWEIAGLKWFEKSSASGSPSTLSVPAASPSSVSSSVPVAFPSSLAPPPSSVSSPSFVTSIVPVSSSVVLSSLNPALNPVSSAIDPAPLNTAAAPAASSAAPAPSNGTGSGSGGGSSPNMQGFIWPTAHVGGSPVASSPAASSDVAASSSPGASIPAASPSSPSLSDPAVSSSSLAASPDPTASPSSAAADSTASSIPAASSTLLNAPTQAANPVASSIAASPVDAAPSNAALSTATAPSAAPTGLSPPAAGLPAASQPAVSQPASQPAASEPAATPLPATSSASIPSTTSSSAAPLSTSSSGSNSSSGTDGSSPNMKGFIWPTKHLGKRAAAVGGVKRLGRTSRW
ncbi:uncharacterized protein N0V89_009549 [Didymosphaeria variabile]|uniref:endo-1,3(4)-beta-glucanase n=1 Tax=Didymosphaeria variabile TaxID=1932322 RepID=A0A9W9C6N7_9PLEO|nr:uncharacterized protein N0V89_009549 [Didymosphaeria variabile]KAJ4348177.1 hypothetical protein N0V89_009549 [Didymosphaeria variabile]